MRLRNILSRNFFDNDLVNLTLYTDGINTFKNSKFSIWPIYFIFNDIHIDKRYFLENIVLCGIWYGEAKPQMQELLKLSLEPLLANFNSKFTFGEFEYRVRLKYIVADKPARSMLLNMQSSNSTYFCPCCLVKSTNKIFLNRRHTFFNFNNGQIYHPRTDEGFAAIAHSSQFSGQPQYGIKGTCFLQNFIHFKLIKSNIFDYMHSVCLGIFKSLFNFLFILPHSQNSYRSHIPSFDGVISSLRFPSNIVKSPPLIRKNNVWKAKDYRNFFLFCFPLLFDDLRSNFILGIFSLREGLLLLFSDEIIEEIASRAKNLFSKFIISFKSNIGKQFLTPNFHDIYHLPEMAKRSGPIYSFSGFNFEHINGLFSNLCHGNKRFDLQIAKKIESMIPRHFFEDSVNESEYCSFINNLFTSAKWKSSLIINSHLNICGKIIKLSHPVSLNEFDFFEPHCEYFEADRAIFKGKQVSTKNYAENKKYANCFLFKKFGFYGITIERIIIKLYKEEYTCFAFISKYGLKEVDEFFYAVSGSIITQLISLEELLENSTFCINYKNKIICIPKLEYF